MAREMAPMSTKGGTMSVRISGKQYVGRWEFVIAIVLASVISASVAAWATLRVMDQACNAPLPNDTRQP
jgi:hypothetical protein